MDRNHLKIGTINWIILLLAAVSSVVAARTIESDTVWCGSILLAAGFLVAIVGWFQMHLEERERAEKLEYDELARSKGESTLFEGGEETFPARRSRQVFEKWFVPIFTLLLVGGMGAAVYWRWKEIGGPELIHRESVLMVVALAGFFGLVLFLFGKYTVGLARMEKQRLLRPVGGFILLGSYVSFTIAIALVAVQAGFIQWDNYVARIFCIITGLIAIEILVGLVFEIYRPRVKGEAARLLYDSRLVGLLGQPEGIFLTAAHALDYQFGFKVSETWFYRFLERRLWLLVLCQAAVLLLSTSAVVIEPGEQGLLEHFGRYVKERGVLEPGLHFKMPFPIGVVQRYSTRQLQSFNIGFVPTTNGPSEAPVVWTISHYKEEFNLLVANRSEGGASGGTNGAVPVSLLTVSIPVQYQISDVEKWAYKYSNSGELLEKVATREVVRYLVGVDLIDMMSNGRNHAAEELRARIQKEADRLEMGVNIVFVGLQDIHPPVKVAGEFEKVVGAQQTRRAKILNAEGYALKTVPMAAANAERLIHEAESDGIRRLMDASSRASQFTNQLVAFATAPNIYPERLYLNTVSRATAGSRKYIVGATNTADVIQINLEDKVRLNLERGVAVPGASIK